MITSTKADAAIYDFNRRHLHAEEVGNPLNVSTCKEPSTADARKVSVVELVGIEEVLNPVDGDVQKSPDFTRGEKLVVLHDASCSRTNSDR